MTLSISVFKTRRYVKAVLSMALACFLAGCAANRGGHSRTGGMGKASVNSTLGHDLRNLPRGRMIGPSAPGVDLARAKKDPAAATASARVLSSRR